MMAKSRVSLSVRLTLFALCALLALPAMGQVAKQGNDVLSSLAFVHEKLQTSDQVEPLDNARAFVNRNLQNGWEAYKIGTGADWQASIERRTGLVTFAEGGNVAWVPGRGNKLTTRDLAGFLGTKARVDLEVMEAIARDYLPRVQSFLGVDPKELVLDRGRSGQPADHLWFVDFNVVREGLPVEGARVVFRVNNGNLVQYGTENYPAPGATVPATRLTQKDALDAVATFIGGFQASDSFRDAGSLHLLPVDVANAKAAEGFEFGNGRGIAKVWQFIFHRDGVMGTWRARVDAATGDVLELSDVNDYVSAQVTGGTYLNSPTTGSEVVRPAPFADVSSGGFTNSAGIYNWTSGTVTSVLNGQYVRITDSCGAISKASDATGNIAFGTSTGTNCTTPGSGGTGNTHSAREQFYQVNRIKEVVRGWLPSNAWINAKLTVNVNLNQTCNAYWNGSTLNFFKSGGGCNNTGEIAGVSLHEFGHGIDQNDGTGTATDGATGESYGDTTALIALHNSCLGAGFLSGNCSGYGDACTACTGVRDADFAKHASNTAATANNFIRVRCPAASGGAGPCGKEVHCESYVPTETMWDLAARDLPSPGTGVAWTILDRLWYLSRNTATKSFACTTGTTYTSNGCSAGSLWKVMRLVDDDDGNLNNGTPHGAALFAAFNRHGIACTTDTGASTTFAGCTPPSAPTLSVTGGSNSASLSWGAVGSSVYNVFRNETGCNAGFTKIASATSATSLPDANVANGLTYYYQVTAYPSGNEACASLPSTCVSVTPAPTTCVPPAAPTGVTSSGTTQTSTTISWSASSGATSYKIFRATTSGGPYTQVGTSATTSFANSGLTCNTSYFYVVTASNGTCDSGNSAQTTVTTSACTGCTPPAAPTGVATSGTTQTSTTVSWTASSGATSYKIFRATTSGGPYTQVGTSATTSFVNSGLTCNTSYFYVVTASNGTCDSGNSAQASATTSACTGCTTHTQYSNTFDTTTGLSGWSTGTFGGGGVTTSWRGVQACTPTHSGSNIFRFGGTACTTTYGDNYFAFAQPAGAAGISIPAGAITNRLSFWHRRSFESSGTSFYDGGALTISVDGTNYEFVPSSAIISGSNYNATVNAACPPAGSAGAGIFGGVSSTMTNTTVDLDAACNVVTGTTTGCAGRSVRIGFTAITDCGTGGSGWFLDDVTVTSCY
jgi:fibronectin type 3 domain-containing protein